MDMAAVAPIARRRRSNRSILKSRVASALCLLPASYCVGVIAFALWNAQEYATEIPQFLRYVAIPAVLCLALVGVGLFGSRVTRVMAGGCSLAILLAMVAFEARLESRYVSALVGLVSVPSPEKMEQLGVGHGLPPANTAKKLDREMGVTRLSDAILSGVPGQRVLLCGNGNHPVLYRADRYGFRNPDRVYSRHVHRLVLGDSFVEGICLPDGHDLVSEVRKTGGNVVGIGTRGAGPLMELAMLGRFGHLVRPDWVVVAFYEGNDWQNLRDELAYPWLRSALAPGADFGPAIMPANIRTRTDRVIRGWIHRGGPKPGWALRKANLLRNSLALHQTWTQLGLGYPKAARDMPVYDRILRQTRMIAARWGGRVALIYIPQTSRFAGLFPNRFIYNQLRDRVAGATLRNDVAMIDLSTAFEAAPDPMTFFAPDGHLSARGTIFAAKTLDLALSQQQERTE